VKHKGKQLASRLTGFSTPVFGLSWEAPVAERDIARELLMEFEDRRVLYNPYTAETPRYCVEAVIQIRACLRDWLKRLGGTGVLSEHVRGLGAASRAFLDRMEDLERMWGGLDIGRFGQDVEFNDALGRLRAVFGVHLAFIAERYDLEIRGELVSILPQQPAEDDLDG
jgi:hypothetical protein